MKLEIIDWLIIFLVPISALIANYIYKKKNPDKPSRRNFGLANQNLSGVAVGATYIGANITFTSIFIILSQEGYKRDFWTFSIPIFWFLGTLLFIRLYPRIRDFIITGKTLHQAIGETFSSSSLKFYASIWTIIAFVLTVGLEFYGGIKLISAANVPFLSYITIVIFFIIIVGYFTAKGGLGGVAYADIVLDLFSFLGIAILLSGIFSFTISLFSHGFPINQITDSRIIAVPTLSENIIFSLSMLILFVPFQFCTFDSWQRLSARKEREKSPTSLLLYSGVLVSLSFCVPILMGMFVKNQNIYVDVANNELVLFKFLEHFKYSSVLLGFIFAGFIASVFSTADELLNCSSYSFLSDALEVKEDREIKKVNIDNSYKFYVIVFSVISALLALIGLKWGKEITDIALAVFSTQIVFILPLYYVFFKKEKASKLVFPVKVSMIVAYISSVVFVITGWLIEDKSLVEGAPIAAILIEFVTFFILKFTHKSK